MTENKNLPSSSPVIPANDPKQNIIDYGKFLDDAKDKIPVDKKGELTPKLEALKTEKLAEVTKAKESKIDLALYGSEAERKKLLSELPSDANQFIPALRKTMTMQELAWGLGESNFTHYGKKNIADQRTLDNELLKIPVQGEVNMTQAQGVEAITNDMVKVDEERNKLITQNRRQMLINHILEKCKAIIEKQDPAYAQALKDEIIKFPNLDQTLTEYSKILSGEKGKEDNEKNKSNSAYPTKEAMYKELDRIVNTAQKNIETQQSKDKLIKETEAKIKTTFIGTIPAFVPDNPKHQLRTDYEAFIKTKTDALITEFNKMPYSPTLEKDLTAKLNPFLADPTLPFEKWVETNPNNKTIFEELKKTGDKPQEVKPDEGGTATDTTPKTPEEELKAAKEYVKNEKNLNFIDKLLLKPPKLDGKFGGIGNYLQSFFDMLKDWGVFEWFVSDPKVLLAAGQTNVPGEGWVSDVKKFTKDKLEEVLKFKKIIWDIPFPWEGEEIKLSQLSVKDFYVDFNKLKQNSVLTRNPRIISQLILLRSNIDKADETGFGDTPLLDYCADKVKKGKFNPQDPKNIFSAPPSNIA